MKKKETDSGIEIKKVYTREDLPEDIAEEKPGGFPFTRGIRPICTGANCGPCANIRVSVRLKKVTGVTIT